MFLGPYNLYDIKSVNEEPTLEITAIVFDLNKKLYHYFIQNHLSLNSKTIKYCIKENNAQVELINLSIASTVFQFLFKKIFPLIKIITCAKSTA